MILLLCVKTDHSMVPNLVVGKIYTQVDEWCCPCGAPNAPAVAVEEIHWDRAYRQYHLSRCPNAPNSPYRWMCRSWFRRLNDPSQKDESTTEKEPVLIYQHYSISPALTR